MRSAVIVDAVRSPFGKGRPSGVLSSVHPVDLFSQVLEALIRRNHVEPGLVEDVISGCVIQVGEQAANIARHAWLATGFPEQVPGVTLDRKCGSSQQAIDFAAQGVIAGAYDLVVAGGIEMMSVVPMRTNRMGRDELGPRLRARYASGLVRQGISAELIAAKWALSREDLDRYALRSHQLAVAARERGRLDRQILAIEVPSQHEGRTMVEVDEGVRPGTSLDQLAGLEPAFFDPHLEERFPEIGWVVTAGNSSQITDGACAILVAEEGVARSLGLSTRVRVRHFAVVGDDPIYMLTGVIPATEKVLKRAGLSIDDIDVFEVNEAFASVVLAWLHETGADPERVNIHGGAIAFGHPVGASGGRLMATLLDALEERDGTWGLQVMCESGGMANATLVERIE